MKENKHFIFSVIISIYDREDYLPECVDSVIGQSVGFEENIQLILVDNGSTDGSAAICREYQQRYPDNVVCVTLTENAGPSGGRSAGVPYVRGELVNFLDSDDKWAPEAFEKVLEFYREHEGEIECLTCRVKAFGDSNNWHALDYVYKKSHVVNIYDEYDQIQTRIASAFVTAEAVRETPMDLEMIRNEDTMFIVKVILRKGKYGAVRGALYYYRRHSGSLMNQVRASIYNYREAITMFHDALLEYSREQYGKVLPFIQFELMYDIGWKLTEVLPKIMTRQDIAQYKDHIRRILLQIDDYIICEQRNIFKEFKIYCLALKYGEDFYRRLKLLDGRIMFEELTLCRTDNGAIFNYWRHEVTEEGRLRLYGEINFPFPPGDWDAYVLDDQGRRSPLVFTGKGGEKKYALGDLALAIRPFVAEAPLEGVRSLRVCLRYLGVEFPLYINAGKFSQLSFDPPESFSQTGEYVFSRTRTEILPEQTSPAVLRQHRRALRRRLLHSKDKRPIVYRAAARMLGRISGSGDVRIFFGNSRVV